MTKLEAALLYASWGWPVVPVIPNGKLPASAHGIRDSTTDEKKITEIWTAHPDLNIGIECGEASGLVVFDIDPRNGGDDSWDLWKGAICEPDAGICQLTAGGGYHYLFEYDCEIKSCKLADGIDLLSDGRYFLVSPSTVEGREYAWELSSSPFDGVAPAPIPMRWLEKISEKKKTASKTNSELIRGNRNAGLTSLAGAMRNYGMSEAEILAAISVANETRCEYPLPTSEIKNIAKSVSRYEPDGDIAADTAVGSVVADRLLENIDAKQRDYFFTRGTSFLSQPSPIPWAIKGWLPAKATGMIYGESGVGKTFIALDMACCIAAGIEWCGKKTKPGVVAYLCGEGNWGFRQRVASWCKSHGVSALDDLLISNKAIDLDGPHAASEVLGALSTIAGEPPSVVFIDTLHAHMVGDENSAKDTRGLLAACGIVAAATGASVILVHHVGHGETAKGRARGSSSWRGAMDVQIYVHSGKGGQGIVVDCAKLKDAPESEAIYGTLESVPLGWIDEDGEPVSGAVFAQMSDEDAQIKDEDAEIKKEGKKTSKWERTRKVFEDAWWVSGAEVVDGAPWLSRAALRAYLVEHRGMAERSATQAVCPQGSVVGPLLSAQWISANNSSTGWTVIDATDSGRLLLLRHSR